MTAFSALVAALALWLMRRTKFAQQPPLVQGLAAAGIGVVVSPLGLMILL